MLRNATLLLALTLAGLSFGKDANAQTDWNDVIDAWTQRDARTKSLQFHWTEQRVEVRSTDKRSPFEPSSNENLKDFKHTMKMEVAFDGEKTRTRRDGKVWYGDLVKFAKYDGVSVYNGKTNAQLTKYEQGRGKFPYYGFASPTPSTTFYRDVAFHVPLYHFRPVRTIMSNGEFTLTKEQPPTEDGVQRVRFAMTKMSRDGSMRTTTITIVPKWDYSITDITKHFNGVLYAERKTQFKELDNEWMPTKWKEVRYSSEAVRNTIDVEVTFYELNKRHPASLYTVVYPVGTFVLAGTREKREEYVIRKDRSRNHVTGKDRQKLSLEQMIEPIK